MAVKSVLLADDDDEILEFTGLRLAQEGLKVTYAHNGKEVLEKIEVELPDLILLDIQMPRPDGWELCRLIKANPVTHHIPVVFLTCKGQDEDIIQIHRSDADGYFIKPFNSSVLAKQIAAWHDRLPGSVPIEASIDDAARFHARALAGQYRGVY